MSFARLISLNAIVSGWCALLGWLAAELVVKPLFSANSTLGVAAMSGFVGAAFGAGLSVVAGLTNGQLSELIRRSSFGALAGALGGGLGGACGDIIFSLGVPRALGFLLLGMGVGVVDGIYERSNRKLRNGVVGGIVGGLLGGFLFEPLSRIVASSSGMSSRAIAFVMLAMVVGASIGMVQILLREAWLTVVDGYRPGRQLILGQNVTVLGRGDHLPLPFLGPANAQLEQEHLRIVRQPDGRFYVEDNHSKTGVFVNHERITNKLLSDNDLIKLGPNIIRFKERRGKLGESGIDSVASAKPIPKAPPPPPAKRAALKMDDMPEAPKAADAAATEPKPSVRTTAPLPPPPPPRRKT